MVILTWIQGYFNIDWQHRKQSIRPQGNSILPRQQKQNKWHTHLGGCPSTGLQDDQQTSAMAHVMQCGWYSEQHGSSNQRNVVCQTKCFLLPQPRHLVQRWTHQLPCQGHCTYLGPQHSPLTILLPPNSTQWERAQSPIQLQLHAMREQSHQGRADSTAQTLCA